MYTLKRLHLYYKTIISELCFQPQKKKPLEVAGKKKGWGLGSGVVKPLRWQDGGNLAYRKEILRRTKWSKKKNQDS